MVPKVSRDLSNLYEHGSRQKNKEAITSTSLSIFLKNAKI